MAAASGMALVNGKVPNPLRTTTYGTGELIRAALDAGAKKIIVGVGGSATNDGGAGMAEAVGVRFLDAAGNPIGRGGEALGSLDRIDVTEVDSRLSGVEVAAACDVENVLCGPAGASAVYGPQKGASPQDVAILDRALVRYGEVIKRSLGLNIFDLRSGGSAGGLGAGLAVFCKATLVRGIDLVLDAIGFDEPLKKASVVITGEGRIDSQMKYGKALAGVLERAARYSVPVLGVAGSVEGLQVQYCKQGMFADIVSLTEEGGSMEEAINNAPELIQHCTSKILQQWVRGNNS
jgi:glycerate kinase